MSSKLSKIVGTEKANIQDLKSLALTLQNPTQEAIYKEVLGPDYPKFKQLMNAIIETAESATGETGTLFLRGLETRGLKGVVQFLGAGTTVTTGAGAVGGAGAAAATGAASVGVGAAALYIPHVFSKVVTNPKYVNQLITMLKSGAKDRYGAELALGVMVSEILNKMSEEERTVVIAQTEQMLANMLTSEQQQGQ